MLPPTDFGGTPTPFGFASRLGRETLLQRWSHQVPLSGNPHQGLAPSGNARRLRRETLWVCVAPPMPAARLRLSGLVATTRLTRARHNSWQRWIHRKALLWAQKWHMRETLPRALDSPDA
ncbi:hypothetical protein DP113_23180 [Brasilonema octagenarum UFV-E1]|uniref:Uncharacterized protein n=1 Tax=Brasilonema sennae CENA114 TaxID=415709 RepID=A0A856MNB6_9CYAN|nr:hypothetical protein DP114_23275 [Brasilonema sennae CENA114]QDL16772.1 hypothetical protein DP113_23180 [Brasilonema octagenarum UFV-E1]